MKPEELHEKIRRCLRIEITSDNGLYEIHGGKREYPTKVEIKLGSLTIGSMTLMNDHWADEINKWIESAPVPCARCVALTLEGKTLPGRTGVYCPSCYNNEKGIMDAVKKRQAAPSTGGHSDPDDAGC